MTICIYNGQSQFIKCFYNTVYLCKTILIWQSDVKVGILERIHNAKETFKVTYYTGFS